jgi:hypothetical protein
MQSTASSDGLPERAKNKWSGFLGTVVAVLTLTLPLISIACYSSFNGSVQTLQDNSSTLPNAE